MKKIFAILSIFACLCFPAVAACAQTQTVTAAMLQKDYNACMGSDTPQNNPTKNQYCLCVRDSMKNWSMEEYGQVAEAEAKAQDASQMPQQLKDVAKACMANIAH